MKTELSVPLEQTLTIILGGGKGTRLFPLTKDRCKPAVPLGGKYRLIDVPISNALNSGLRHIFILTQFLSASLHRHVSETYQMGPFSKGFVNVLAANQTVSGVEDWFEGTADAVRKCLSMANIHHYKRVVILSGDQLYKMNLQQILRTHEDRQSMITVGVQPVREEFVNAFGIMRINNEGQILDFVEKPVDSEVISGIEVSQGFLKENGLEGSENKWLASMGIYVFETDILLNTLRDKSQNDFGKDIIPSALNIYPTFSHLFKGYWEDIGTIKAFFNANILLGLRKPLFDFFGKESEKIFTSQRFLSGSRFVSGSISESIISDGCMFSENVSIKRSVVGIRSRIGKNADLDRVVVMGADSYERPDVEAHLPLSGIGANVVIRDAILDKNVTIGDGARLINDRKLKNVDGKNYFIRDGIIIIPKNVVIEPCTVI